MEHQLETIDAGTRRILDATFPNYRGRSITISDRPPHNLNSYWDGGSRSVYVFYRLNHPAGLVREGELPEDTMRVQSNHPVFEKERPRELRELPPDTLLVEHHTFCGRITGITIYARPENIAAMLPAPGPELSDDEMIVLEYTASLKSSYAGVSNYRYHQANRDNGITLERWESAKQALIESKHLNKAGAITPKGHNARNEKRSW